jgi:hypothetical protein
MMDVTISFGDNRRTRIAMGNMAGLRDLARKERDLGQLLAAVVAINENILRDDPTFPRLYARAMGARYSLEPERKLGEEVATLREIRQRKLVDCDDAVCARVAELRVRDNIMAYVAFVWRIDPKTRAWSAHIVVEYPDGTQEDPSRRLGMGR